MNIVVGSGPAGVAAARALLDRGESVTLLDVGQRLPAANAEALKNLRSKPRDLWNPIDLDKIRGSARSSHRGVELKTAYGSDFAYRSLDEVQEISKSVLIRASYALGGLSNVWGGAVLPYHARDTAAWPIPLHALQPHYQKILSRLDFSAVDDELAKLLPLHAQPSAPLKPSRQAEQFLAKASPHRDALLSAGLHLGRSRLAVRAAPDSLAPGCVYCGNCLTGCPYELIFDSTQWIEEWKNQIRFSYRPNILVEKLREINRGVEVQAVDQSTQQRVNFAGDRVYLAGGILSTAKIVLSSLEQYDREYSVKASQYFLFPFLTKTGVAGVRSEDLHTLAQFFLEVNNKEVTSHLINLQGYTYNPFLGNYLTSRLGPLAKILRPMVDGFLGRLLIFQGYLHSDDSPHITMKLVKTVKGDRLQISRADNSQTKPTIRRLLTLLRRHKKILGGVPLSWMTAIGKIGDGSHLGGIFPMQKNPGPAASDILGRPTGFRHVHLVDSSVFPSIPATTITLSVMANAHRIASDSLESV